MDPQDGQTKSMASKNQCNVRVIADDEYLHVEVEGVWNNETALEIMKTIVSLYDTTRHSGVLVDCRHLKVDTNLAAAYFHIEELAKMDIQREGRFAVLDDRENEGINSFIETAAANRGLNLRYFYSDAAEAISWIRKR